MIRTRIRRRPAAAPVIEDAESRLERRRARDFRARDRQHVRQLALQAYEELEDFAA